MKSKINTEIIVPSPPRRHSLRNTPQVNSQQNLQKTDGSDSTLQPFIEVECSLGDGDEPPEELLFKMDELVQLTDTEEESTEEYGIPYDHGWAWMVVLGVFLNLVLLFGYVKSRGLLLVELKSNFNASTTHVSLLFSIHSGIYSFSGLIVMNVFLDRFGSRPLALTGGLLMSLSAILASMANELLVLISIQATFLGMGMALLNGPGEVLVGHYFKKRRPLALALVKCGVSLGSMSCPPLITFLMKKYGLSDTLFIFGGICLTSLPAAMLLRPTSFYYKLLPRRLTLISGKDDDKASKLEMSRSGSEYRLNTQPLDQTGQLKLGEMTNVQISEKERDDISQVAPIKGLPKVVTLPSATRSSDELPIIDRSRGSMFSVKSYPSYPRIKFSQSPFTMKELMVFVDDKDHDSLRKSPDRNLLDDKFSRANRTSMMNAFSRSNILRYMSISSPNVLPVSLMHGSLPDFKQKHLEKDVQIADEVPEDWSKTELSKEKAAVPWSCGKFLDYVLWCPMSILSKFNFQLCRKPRFRLLLIFIGLSQYINITLDFLPDLVIEKGLNKSHATELLSLIGGFDLFCRLMSGFIANLKILRATSMIMIAFSILALLMQFVRFMTSFNHFLFMAIMQGMLGGVGNCLAPVLIIEFVGLSNMGKAIGFCQMTIGISNTITYAILGYIRDATGSYVLVYHVIGLATLLAAVILFCARPVKKRQSTRRIAGETIPRSQSIATPQSKR